MSRSNVASANTIPPMPPPATSTRGFLPLVPDGAGAVSTTVAAFAVTILTPRACYSYRAARCRPLWCDAGCSSWQKRCIFAAEVAERNAMGMDPTSCELGECVGQVEE
jgi:hypothetical protein